LADHPVKEKSSNARNILVPAAALLAILSSMCLHAQQLQPRSAADAVENQQNDDSSGPQVDATGGTNDRLFWTLPNFMSIEKAQNVRPLTRSQKFKLVFRSSFDPVEFPYYAFLAGIDQAENDEAGYGQGGIGYAKRYGSNFADGTADSLFVSAVFPSLFRQDPRYFQNGKGSFLHRAGYAVSRIVVTRSDSGHAEFNVSEIAGAGAAAALSNTYHPAGDRSVSDTAITWGSLVGWDMMGDVLREFWPDIRRKMHRNKG
jgi:hypothetical protein